MINIYVSVKIQNNMCAESIYYVQNPAKFSCENGKYLGSIVNDSVVICDEFMGTTFHTRI